MAETDTATAITPSVSTAVTYTVLPASETCSAAQVFNPLLGYWLSDPLLLTGEAVTGSIVRWESTGSVVVETSINNGASWDTATNNQPVPRLRRGDTSTKSVLAKITLSRTSASDPSPTVSSFELDVSVDASVDEFIPVAHGMIDDVTTHSVAGSMGSGSSTNGASSTAVTSRGGGQSGGGTSIKVHANDLSYAIRRNLWQQPFALPAGMLYTDAIKAMVQNRLPSQTAFNMTTTTVTTPLLLFGAKQGGDPWQDIQDLAAAIGYEVYFDPMGVCVVRPIPDPSSGEPVWSFDENLVPLVAEAEFELSSEQTFNDIVIVGQSTSSANPFSAEAYDNDPNSPTYILGDYGRVSQRVSSSQVMSQYQAQAMAYSALYASLGAANKVKLTTVPMPHLEPGDIVNVVCSEIGANGRYMVNDFILPLSPADPQSFGLFRQSTSGTLGLAGAFSVTDGILVNGSNVITSASANFTAGVVGASVYGDGIPVNATITSVTNSTTAVMSANATATASGVYLVVSVASGT